MSVGDVVLFRRPSRYATAKYIERKCSGSEKHPLLSIALELHLSTGGNELVDEVYRRAREQLTGFAQCSLAPKRPLLYGGTIFTVALLLLSVVKLQPQLLDYWVH